MTEASELVRTFFAEYERGTNAADLELLSSRYADAFMFGGPQGTQAVRQEDFLKVRAVVSSLQAEPLFVTSANSPRSDHPASGLPSIRPPRPQLLFGLQSRAHP